MTDVERYLIKKKIERLNKKILLLEILIAVMVVLVFAGFLIKTLF